MLEVYLRPIYQTCLAEPAAKWLSKYSPVQITYLGCLLGILVAPALMYNFAVIATVLLFASGFLDTLDGTVARLHNKTTDFGGILDIVCDRIVELAVILGLFAVDPAHRAIPTLAILGSCYLCITAFLVAGIYKNNTTQKGYYYRPGLVERAEAFLFFTLMMWFPHIFSALAYIFACLMLVTTYFHIRGATE